MGVMTPQKLKYLVGQNIKARREEKGLTRKELAELIGVQSRVVGRMERGEFNPSVLTLLKYSEALGCRVWELLKDE